MPGPSTTGIPAGYMPAYGSGVQSFKATITNAAQRLITIIGAANFPWVVDEMFTYSEPGSSGPTGVKRRAPFHVLFQVPIAAANPVYMTWDNNTTPVVGGPGLELEQGTVYQFGNAGPSLMIDGGKTAGFYQVSNLTAFQLIAAANTTCLITFTD